MLEVSVSTRGNTTRAKALVDTGSPLCVLTRGVADLLQIEFEASTPMERIEFLGRSWWAVIEEVSLSIGPNAEFSWSADVAFVRDDGLPFGLLGHEGFETKWSTTFNGAYGYFVVSEPEHSHDKTDKGAITDLRGRHPELFPQGLNW